MTRLVGYEPITDYNMALEDYEFGILTREEWHTYCTSCLEKLMEENKEVLDRLKNF